MIRLSRKFYDRFGVYWAFNINQGTLEATRYVSHRQSGPAEYNDYHKSWYLNGIRYFVVLGKKFL